MDYVRDGAEIYDDYAHHPTEIADTAAAAKVHFPGRRIVALFHRRPQLSCTRIKAKADRVAKPGRDHLMSPAVRIVAMNGRAHFRVACDEIGRRANGQIHLARALIE